jgi:protein-disulfide isomerase
MAGRVNLRLFYGGLAVIALIGAGAIWMASTRARRGEVQILEAPVPVGTSTFPGFVIGSDSAPVEIVEYADFECPACAAFTILAGPDIKQRLVATGLARWRFRGYPLYQKSLLSHHAAHCAGEQQLFWEMHDLLMQYQSEWLTSRRQLGKFREYAQASGVNLDDYDECMREGRYASQILATRDEIAALVKATPTFDIGDVRLVGAQPFDTIAKYVRLAAETSR